MTDGELKAIKARADAATPGPWELREDTDYYQSGTYIGVDPHHYVHAKKVQGRPSVNPHECYFSHDVARVEGTDADRDFLLCARTDVPQLLEEIERLRDAERQAFVAGWDARRRHAAGLSTNPLSDAWDAYKARS